VARGIDLTIEACLCGKCRPFPEIILTRVNAIMLDKSVPESHQKGDFPV
jgi:hypothetical protein